MTWWLRSWRACRMDTWNHDGHMRNSSDSVKLSSCWQVERTCICTCCLAIQSRLSRSGSKNSVSCTVEEFTCILDLCRAASFLGYIDWQIFRPSFVLGRSEMGVKEPFSLHVACSLITGLARFGACFERELWAAFLSVLYDGAIWSICDCNTIHYTSFKSTV